MFQTGSTANVPGEIERFGASRTGIGASHDPRPFDPSQTLHQGKRTFDDVFIHLNCIWFFFGERALNNLQKNRCVSWSQLKMTSSVGNEKWRATFRLMCSSDCAKERSSREELHEKDVKNSEKDGSGEWGRGGGHRGGVVQDIVRN